MMTPYVHDEVGSRSQRKYNKVHAKTRNPVERAFGALKGRFPILKTELAMENEAEDGVIIAACFVLHNWCFRHERDSMGYLEDAVTSEEGSSAAELVDKTLDHTDDDHTFNPRDYDAVQLEAGRAKRRELERIFSCS